MEFLLVYQDDLMSQSPNNKNASPKEKVKKKKIAQNDFILGFNFHTLWTATQGDLAHKLGQYPYHIHSLWIVSVRLYHWDCVKHWNYKPHMEESFLLHKGWNTQEFLEDGTTETDIWLHGNYRVSADLMFTITYLNASEGGRQPRGKNLEWGTI